MKEKDLAILAIVAVALIGVGTASNLLWMLVWWGGIGLVAGLVANFLTKGDSKSLPSSLMLGLIGAVVGNFLVQTFRLYGLYNNFGASVIIATLGAILLILVGRALKPSRY